MSQSGAHGPRRTTACWLNRDTTTRRVPGSSVPRIESHTAIGFRPTRYLAGHSCHFNVGGPYNAQQRPPGYACPEPGGYSEAPSGDRGSPFVLTSPYAKPATTIADQMTRLRARGMEIADEDLAQRWLRTVGYYRLSIYWLPFECPPGGGQTRSRTFETGTRFEDVRDIYVFDRASSRTPAMCL